MKNAEHHERCSGSLRRSVSLLFLLAAMAGASPPVPDRPAPALDPQRKAVTFAFWYNFMDRNGRLISARDYAEVWPFKNGLAAVKLGDLWGYIGKTGEFAVEPKFEAVCRFFPATDPAPVKAGGKWGYIDRAGTFVIEPKFDEAFEFAEGLAAVRVGVKRGYIDLKGRIAFYVEGYEYKVAPDQEVIVRIVELGAFKEGAAVVKVEHLARDVKTGNTGQWDVMDYVTKDGVLKRFRLKFASNIDRNMLVVSLLFQEIRGSETEYWVMPKDALLGPEFVPAGKPISFVHLRDLGDGYYHVRRGRDLFENLMDREGNLVSKEWFTSVLMFSEGLAAVWSREPYGGTYKRGYIDMSGNLVIPLRDIDAAEYFREGLAANKVGGKWGYIDKTGRWAIEPRFVESAKFTEGLAVVRYTVDQPEIGWALIDKSGQEVVRFPNGYWPCNIWDGMVFSEGLMVVTRREAAKTKKKADK